MNKMSTFDQKVYYNNYHINIIMLTLMSLVQTVNSHKSFSSDFDASNLNPDLKETSRNLIVSNVRTLLQLNPTDLRTKILDNGISLDVNKLLSEKGVYMYNDSSLNDHYSYFTNFLQTVSKTCKYKCKTKQKKNPHKNKLYSIFCKHCGLHLGTSGIPSLHKESMLVRTSRCSYVPISMLAKGSHSRLSEMRNYR